MPNLPREIIKWIQGLDLSYSVKDPKRDLSNGFLIAEIFSRYYPGAIQMHSFDNSQKVERRTNNWFLLEKFFNKHKDIPLSRKDFEDILKESNMDALIDFMMKMYTFLTSRKVTRPTVAMGVEGIQQQQLQQTGQETTSFILKDKGLEKLKDIEEEEEKKEEDKDKKEKEKVEKEKPKKEEEDDAQSRINSSMKIRSIIKVESHKIKESFDPITQQLQVQGAVVKQLTVPFGKTAADRFLSADKLTQQNLSIRSNNLQDTQLSSAQLPGSKNQLDLQASPQYAPSQHQSHSATGETKSRRDQKYDQTIFDILNERISRRLTMSQFEEDVRKLNIKNISIFQYYTDNIEIFSDGLNQAVFRDILDNIEELAKHSMRDLNELWKFMTFLFQAAKVLSIDKPYFTVLIDIIRSLGEKFVEKKEPKFIVFFHDNFLEPLAKLVESTTLFEKKEHLIKILFCFCPNTPESRLEFLASYKKALAKNFPVFLQSLVVLLCDDILHSSISNTQYYEYFWTHAKIGYYSSNPNAKTMGLALIANYAILDANVVYDFYKKNKRSLENESWWENKCLVLAALSRVTTALVESQDYKDYVKKLNPLLTKNYNYENELKANRLREEVDSLARSMSLVAAPNSIEIVQRNYIIYTLGFASESKEIISHIVNAVLTGDDEFRKWFYENQGDFNDEEYIIINDRSLKHKININSEAIIPYAKDFLLVTLEMITEGKIDQLRSQHFEIIAFAFRYTDFKLLNVEILQNAVDTLLLHLFEGLCDEINCATSAEILKFVIANYLKGDVKVKDIEDLFGSAVQFMFTHQLNPCIENVGLLLEWLREEVERRGTERGLNQFRDIVSNIQKKAEGQPTAQDIEKFVASLMTKSSEQPDEPVNGTRNRLDPQVDNQLSGNQSPSGANLGDSQDGGDFVPDKSQDRSAQPDGSFTSKSFLDKPFPNE